MDVKLLEVRDIGTFIPMLALKPIPRSEEERYLLARAGYGRSPDDQGEYVLLGKLVGGDLHYDPYHWRDGQGRTMRTVHLWLQEHWFEVHSGDVVDVEYLLGETHDPKASERF